MAYARAIVFSCLFIYSAQGRTAGQTVEKLFQIATGQNCSHLLSADPEVTDLLGQLVKLKTEIIKRYPPQNFQIIGIGQSPSLVIAALKSRSENYAFNLPLSSFRALIDVNGVQINSGLRPPARKFSEDHVRLLCAHFFRYIPVSEKQLVLIDFSSTGSTLISVYFYLNSCLGQNRAKRKISIFALIGKYKRSSIVSSMIRDLENLGYFDQAESFISYPLSGPLGQVISNMNDEFAISEFGKFDITNPPAPVKVSVSYNNLVDWLRNIEQ